MSVAVIADDMPLDPDDELLVAYLDGELDRSDRTTLENRLLDDATLRTRLHQLQSGWDMLEALPEPAPSVKLVETTLELVVADIVKAKRSQSSWMSRFQYPLGVIAACLISALIGLGVTRLIQRRGYRNELRELAIAENLDAYNHAVDLELMRQLNRDPDWQRMVSASQQLGELPEPRTTVASIPLDEREQAIAEMPINIRTQLYSRWERYSRLDPATRTKIQSVADVVGQQTDRDKLLETMHDYAIWRESLPAGVVDSIERSTGAERDAAIDEAIAGSMVAISERASRKLSDDAIESIYFVLRQIQERRFLSLSAEARSKFDDFKKLFGGSRPGDESESEWRGLSFLFGPRDSRRSRMPSPPFMAKLNEPLRQEELQWIRMVLSPEDLETLSKSTGDDALLEEMTIKTWAEEAIRRKAPWNRRDETPAMQRYLEVPEDRRDEFDLMPPKEMLRELNRGWGRYSG